MGLLRKKKKPTPLTRDQALACTPVRNNIVKWETLESGLVQVEYVLILNPFLKSIFERFGNGPAETPTRKLELDALGSQVWQMIDACKTFRMQAFIWVTYSLGLLLAETGAADEAITWLTRAAAATGRVCSTSPSLY